VWCNCDKPEVDIFVTTCNHASWIEKAMASAADQEFRRAHNIYLYDDHSTKEAFHPISGLKLGGARQVLWKLQEVGFDVVISRDNVGVCKARNDLAKRGSAPWMLFLDGDDYIDSKFLEMVWRKAQTEQADVVYPKVAIFTDQGLAQHGTIDQGVEFDRVRLLRSNYIPVTALIRRELFLSCNGFDENMKYGFEDWSLWITLLGLGAKFVFEPAAVLYYRHHAAARSHTANAKFREIFEYIKADHAELYNMIMQPRVEWLE